MCVHIAAAEKNRQSKRLGRTILACLIHMDFFRASEGRGSMCVCSWGHRERSDETQLSSSPSPSYRWFLLADFIVLCPFPPHLVSVPFLSLCCHDAALSSALPHHSFYNKGFCVDDAKWMCMCLWMYACEWLSTAAGPSWECLFTVMCLLAPLTLSRLSSPGIKLTKKRPKYD